MRVDTMIGRQKTASGNRRDKRASRGRGSRRTGLGLEALESRFLLSSVAWTGGDGGIWSNPDNWTVAGTNAHQVPGSADDAMIGSGAKVYADTAVTILSVLVQSGGALQVGDNLTVSDGLTNAGTIEWGGHRNQTLTVSHGTFLNTGSIAYHGGDYNGYLFAKLDNRGTISDTAGYLHINTTGDGIEDPQPVDPVFTVTNTGAIVLSNGAHCYVGGILNPSGLGTLQGTGYLGIETVAWHLDTDWTLPTTSVVIGLNRSSVAGVGTLTIPKGDAVALAAGSTIDVNVVNHGTLAGFTASTINGQLTLPADSILAVGFDALPFPSQYPDNEHIDTPTNAVLTVTRGFTNFGTINLFNASLGSILNVTNGMLVNAPGGVISSSLGYETQGKDNILNAQLDNLGTITLSGCDLTISNGFTNRGTIDMSSTAPWKELTVTNGTLVNAAGASITLQGQGVGSGADIAAQVDNQGTISVNARQLSVNPNWATGYNPAWTFTNTGAIHTGDAAVFSVGGKFNPNQGTIDGNGALLFEGAAVGLSADWSPTIPVFMADTTVAGPGKLVILAGNGVGMGGAAINASVDNHGVLWAFGLTKVSDFTPVSSTINGPLTMAAGSILLAGYDSHVWNNTSHAWLNAFMDYLLQTEGNQPTDANLTIGQGFINHGQVEFSKVRSGSTLNVPSGTLVNASDGTITSSLGEFSEGNSNFLNAQLDNQGTITVSGANLTINQQLAGSWFSLTNEANGTIDVAAGRTLTVGGMAVVNQGAIRLDGNATVDFAVFSVTMDGQGSLQGEPEGTMHVRGSLRGNTQNITSYTQPGTVWLDGHGTAAVPQLLEVMQPDQGDIAEGYANPLAYHALKLGADTYVKLIDQTRNSPGFGAEAAYTDSLVVPVGTTLDLNHLHLYAHHMSIDGDVVNGPSPWHNYANPCDVDGNGHVAPLDVLIVINYINAHPGSTALPPAPLSPPLYYDVADGPDGDGQVTALDVLTVIKFLDVQSAGAAEGEAAAQPVGEDSLSNVPALGTDAWPLAAGAEQSLTTRTAQTSASSLDGDVELRAADYFRVPVTISASDAQVSFARSLLRPALEPDLEAIDAHLTPLDDIIACFASDIDQAWRA
ncbi:MAG: dockerin type I domain-containing protein [Planctomycetota bacterium]|nr:dockerin type I domain-containing protein [Planctomycetota bacterium]